MKNVSFIIIILISIGSFIGCAPQRLTVEENLPSISQVDCSPQVLEVNEPVPSSATFIAHASYGDSGFTFKCSEDYRRSLMKEEACSVGANIIKINKEAHPSIWSSSCYRAKVEYYKGVLDNS